MIFLFLGIRNHLIEADHNQCPDCKKIEISPDTLIPNRYLRNKVNDFRNQTGFNGGGINFSRRNKDVEPAKINGMTPDYRFKLLLHVLFSCQELFNFSSTNDFNIIFKSIMRLYIRIETTFIILVL